MDRKQSRTKIVVVNQNMPLLDKTLGAQATVRRFPGINISKTNLQGADALQVRSVTHVNLAPAG